MHRRSILAAALSAGAASACGSEGGPQLAPSASALPPAPVARPAAVRGTATLQNVQRVHELLRETYGLSILPGQRWGASAVVLTGLPITATETVDEGGVIRFALVDVAPSLLELVIAIPLRAPDKLIATVTAGEGAGHRLTRDADQLDWLRPTGAGDHPGVELAVARNHLVVGTTATGVGLCAAFLANPEPSQLTAGEGDLGGELSAQAAAYLLRKLEPLKQLVGPEVRGLQDLFTQGELANGLAQVEKVTLTLRLTPEAIRVDAALTRAAGTAEPAVACAQGPRSELLEIGAGATVALTTFSSDQARRASAASAARWIRTARLVDEDQETRIAAALDALASARGPGLRITLEKGPMGWLAYGSSQLDDAAAVDAALDQLDETLALAPEPARAAELQLSMDTTVLERVGDVRRLRVRKRDADAKAHVTLATVLLRRSAGRLALATGVDAAHAMGKALGQPGPEGSAPPSLAALPSVRALLVDGLDERASSFFFADPAALFAVSRPVADGARSVWLGSLNTCASSWSLRSLIDPRAALALARALTASGTSAAPRAR